MTPPVLDLVTWNLHRGRGSDGRIDPARILEVLAEEVCRPAPAILVLQEADAEAPPHRAVICAAEVTARTGLSWAHHDPVRRWGDETLGFLGNAVFLHPSIKVTYAALVDLPGHHPRGAVVLDLDTPIGALRLAGLHLSLGQPARIAQMRTLGQHLTRLRPCPTVIAGDMNEWRPWGGLALSRPVLRLDARGPACATFPVRRPLLPLDRVLGALGAEVAEVRALDGSGIRAASDHRPLRARIVLPGEGQRPDPVVIRENTPSRFTMP